MSVRFRHWYATPLEVHDMGHWAEMSDGAVRLYGALCRMVDKRSDRKFELKDEDVVRMSGVSKRRLSDARKDLFNRGLVVCDREPGGRFVYVICDPRTRQPYPGNSKAKIPYTKESPSPMAPPADETPAAPPVAPAAIIAPAVSTKATDAPPESIGDASEEGLDDSCDVSFLFGWNLITPTVYDYNPFLEKRSAYLA